MKYVFLSLFSLLVSWQAEAVDQDTKLLRFPSISSDSVAFVYANDIWTGSRQGGQASRLTSHPGQEWFPRFSPDGKWIAFTGDYDGNTDVYVIPATGGAPRRLTWSPDISGGVPGRFGPDNAVLGWTKDGKIIFRSRRDQWNVFMGRPWVVSPEGGPASPLGLPYSGLLSLSPDGSKVAFCPTFREFRTWKKYRGGMAQDILVMDLGTGETKTIIDSDSVDDFPMWHGDTLFFVSDRTGRANLYSYNFKDKTTKQLTHYADYDLKWPSLGPDGIVFELAGELYLYTFSKQKAEKISFHVPSDDVFSRPRVVDVQNRIEEYWLSPDAKRALFVARGELFSVPAEHGATRNLTRTSGVRERHAMWSPDGKTIAYLSDETGEYEVYVRTQDGKDKPVQLTKDGHGFRFQLVWSPDSKRLAFGDKDQRIWWIDVKTKNKTLVDESKYWEMQNYSWSADSRYLAYEKPDDTYMTSIWIFDTKTGKTHRVTSKMFDDSEPVFGPRGKYLYFMSRRDFNATLATYESNFVYTHMTRPYALVLHAKELSPFAPRSDEACAADKNENETGAKDTKAHSCSKAESKEEKIAPIDFDGLEKRVVAFPVPACNCHDLRAVEGMVLWVDGPTATLTGKPEGKSSLHVFDLDKRKDQKVYEPVDGYEVASLGKKLIYRSDGKYYIVDIKPDQKPDGKNIKALDLSGLRMQLDPSKEWKQIFVEGWRLMRDHFFAPNMRGLDWLGVRKRYESLLPYVAHRQDLTYIMGEMISELGTSHSYVGGGDVPNIKKVSVGLLGADLEPDPSSGRWRIKKIFKGQNWDHERASPLTEPGLDVSVGDYILEINGQQLRLPDVPGKLLLDRAGRQTVLRISRIPSKTGSKEITIVPLKNDSGLRYYDWVEQNRLYVEKRSGGKIGYIHIPDMGGEGLNEFARTFYPQVRKKALIIDVRWNGGGFVSQMIIERLRRVLGGMDAARGGGLFTYPDAVHVGPKVCLINQWSASDGDLFPHFFRHYKLGKLVGRRTWGGVVGIRGSTNLVDGGYVYQPEFAYYGLNSRWMIENHGVDPDIRVDNQPSDVLHGKDAQLDQAIKLMLDDLERATFVLPPRPADPQDRGSGKVD